MTAESLFGPFAQLSTPLIADAALRLKIPFRIAPAGIRPVSPGQRVPGPALPVRHFGSVDVFLEPMQDAQPGDVLVIDNGGRLDEGCIGDLTALEAEAAVLLESSCGACTATHQSCSRLACQFSATGPAPRAHTGWILATRLRCYRRGSGTLSLNALTWLLRMTTAAYSSLQNMLMTCCRSHVKSGNENGVRRQRSKMDGRCVNSWILRSFGETRNRSELHVSGTPAKDKRRD